MRRRGILAAPAGTPEAIVERLHAEVRAVPGTAAFRERPAASGSEPGSGSAKAFGAFVASEVDERVRVGRDARIVPA